MIRAEPSEMATLLIPGAFAGGGGLGAGSFGEISSPVIELEVLLF